MIIIEEENTLLLSGLKIGESCKSLDGKTLYHRGHTILYTIKDGTIKYTEGPITLSSLATTPVVKCNLRVIAE